MNNHISNSFSNAHNDNLVETITSTLQEIDLLDETKLTKDQIALLESTRDIKFQDGTTITVDQLHSYPVGYERYDTYLPGSMRPPKKIPNNFGKSYVVQEPKRGAGYVVIAYPAVKQYIVTWTE